MAPWTAAHGPGKSALLEDRPLAVGRLASAIAADVAYGLVTYAALEASAGQ
jgi:hypothetical protein